MRYLTSVYSISRGLMFASKKKIKKGVCLVMPSEKDGKYGSSVTMMFCFHKMQIIFVNTKMKVVDKVTLRPWKLSYTPKAPCKYILESTPKTFDKIEIGDKVEFS